MTNNTIKDEELAKVNGGTFGKGDSVAPYSIYRYIGKNMILSIGIGSGAGPWPVRINNVTGSAHVNVTFTNPNNMPSENDPISDWGLTKEADGTYTFDYDRVFNLNVIWLDEIK